MKKALVETQIRGETFTHKILWECCLRQIETARRRTRGTKYFHITAMLMAYLTYEAYITFLGDRFAPEIWKDEREFFSKPPYSGIEGKLKKIGECCPISGINKGRRPYQTIKNLKILRDFLSHCKPDKYELTTIHSRDNEPPLFGEYGKIDKLVSKKQAGIAIKDVEEFIVLLHTQASKRSKDIWFGRYATDALGGIRGYSSSDSRAKN